MKAAPNPNDVGRRRARTLLLVAFALIVFAGSVPGRELLPPDEPRFGLLAQDMIASGDWVLLRSGGEPYLEKPPLFVWGIGLGMLALGQDSEAAARLPSLIATLLIVVVLHRAGRRHAGEPAATHAVLIYLSSSLILQRGAWAAPDALLSLAVIGTWDALERARDGSRVAPYAAALCVAAGLLSKGPIILLFLALAWLGALLARAPGIRPLALLRPGPFALLVLLSAPWPIALVSRIGFDAARAALERQTLERAIHSWDNIEPWYYFLIALPLAMLPWPILLSGGLSPGVVRRLLADRGARAHALWVLLCLVFFSLPAGKRGVYLMPVLPVLALLFARALPLIAQRRTLRRLTLVVAAGASLAAGCAGLAVLFADRSGGLLPASMARLAEVRIAAGALLLLLALALLSMVALGRRDLSRGLACGAALLAGTTGLLWPPLFTPAINRAQIARTFASEARRAAPAPTATAFVRGKHETVAFYTGWRGPQLHNDAEVLAFLSAGPGRVVVGREDRLPAPESWPEGCRAVHRGRIGRAELLVLRTGDYEHAPG